MTDYGTIRIPREDFKRHNERRQDLGLTWAAYLDGQAPDAPDVDEATLAAAVADDLRATLPDEVADAVAERLR